MKTPLINVARRWYGQLVSRKQICVEPRSRTLSRGTPFASMNHMHGKRAFQGSSGGGGNGPPKKPSPQAKTPVPLDAAERVQLLEALRLFLSKLANLGTPPRMVDGEGDPLGEGVRTLAITNWLHNHETCSKHIQASTFEPMAVAWGGMLAWARASGMSDEVRLRCASHCCSPLTACVVRLSGSQVIAMVVEFLTGKQEAEYEAQQ